jgi:[ribosomal protein S18]-alanine N-acetyltransferase
MSLPLLKVVQRPMIRSDLSALLEIERANAFSPWTEAEFRLWFTGPGKAIGVVAMCGMTPVGYIVYEIGEAAIEIKNMAVRPIDRRRGIARQMMARLGGKMVEFHRPRLLATVRDGNLPMHLFLRSHGFRAVQVCRGHYPDTGEDGYKFEYLLREPVPLCVGA